MGSVPPPETAEHLSLLQTRSKMRHGSRSQLAMLEDPPKAGAKPPPGLRSGSNPPAGMEFKKLINNIDLCDGVNPKYQEMCDGFEEYLINCPSFTNDVCHRDD